MILLRRFVQAKTPVESMEPHENDILMGRGGKNNQHVGNERLRGLARVQSDNYRMASKKGKSYISRELVKQVRLMNPPGRFLKKNNVTGTWEDVGDDVAREKASQVLRDAVSGSGHSHSDASEEEIEPLVVTRSTERGSRDRRPSSAPPVSMAEHNRRRTWHEARGYHSSPRMAASPIYPPVTPSTHSTKRRRYQSETWDERLVSRMQTTPIRHPYGHHPDYQRSASYSAPTHPHAHYPPRPYEQPSGMVGEVGGGGLDEFDLFNGELLNSDGEEEERKDPPPYDLPHQGTF